MHGNASGPFPPSWKNKSARQIPEATILMRTSPAAGTATWTVSILSGSPADQTTAARHSITYKKTSIKDSRLKWGYILFLCKLNWWSGLSNEPWKKYWGWLKGVSSCVTAVSFRPTVILFTQMLEKKPWFLLKFAPLFSNGNMLPFRQL